jgi:tetratricopeptide (TPR) repeat protein
VRRSRAIEYVRRAAILFEKGDYKKTVTLCRQAADWYPTYARSYIWMGAAYQKLRNYKEARSAYKWVIALAPNSPDATRARRGLKEIGYSDF